MRDEADLGSRAFAYALAIRDETGMDGLVAALRREIEPFGLTAAASGVISGPKAISLNPFHFTLWRQDWIERYVNGDFLLLDPIPRWARNCGQPITWRELFRTLPPRDRGRKVIEAAAAYGYTEGLAVPTRTNDNSLGLVTFGGARGQLTTQEQICLTMIARATFDQAERIEKPGEMGRPAAILSAREIECLALLIRGHSDRQIAEMLGVTEPTVRFHLGNAREKSGAVSRTHLAALMVTQGFVAP
jgi:LuxR family transcriptional activator of bioluminescence operon